VGLCGGIIGWIDGGGGVRVGLEDEEPFKIRVWLACVCLKLVRID